MDGKLTLILLLPVLFVLATVICVFCWKLHQMRTELSKETEKNTNIRKLFELLDECLFEYSYTDDCMYLENNEILFHGEQEISGFLSDNLYDFRDDTERIAVGYLKEMIEERLSEKEVSLDVDGEEHWYRLRMRFVAEDYVVGCIADISKKMKERTRLRMLATTDPLTRLENRYSLELFLKHHLAQEKRDGVYLLMDLDNFKSVNDHLGHKQGDFLLQETCRYLRERYPSPNITARLGGDEFVVFLRGQYTEEELAGELTVMLQELDERVFDRYKKFGVSASIGAAPIREEITNADALYKEADSAMYVAKNTGKNTFFISDGNTCMRKTCIQCKADCKRGKAMLQFQNQQKSCEMPDQARGGVKFYLLFVIVNQIWNLQKSSQRSNILCCVKSDLQGRKSLFFIDFCVSMIYNSQKIRK